MQDFKEELLKIPELKYQKQSNMLLLAREKLELKQSISKIENAVITEVALEKVDNKPKFSNETARSAEVKLRLDFSQEYRETENKIRLIDKQIDDLKAEVEFLNDKMKVYMTIMNMK